MARLFPPDEPQTPLELLSSETFESGVLNLVYAPAECGRRISISVDVGDAAVSRTFVRTTR
jgi:hypothetical protein